MAAKKPTKKSVSCVYWHLLSQNAIVLSFLLDLIHNVSPHLWQCLCQDYLGNVLQSTILLLLDECITVLLKTIGSWKCSACHDVMDVGQYPSALGMKRRFPTPGRERSHWEPSHRGWFRGRYHLPAGLGPGLLTTSLTVGGTICTDFKSDSSVLLGFHPPNSSTEFINLGWT